MIYTPGGSLPAMSLMYTVALEGVPILYAAFDAIDISNISVPSSELSAMPDTVTTPVSPLLTVTMVVSSE